MICIYANLPKKAVVRLRLYQSGGRQCQEMLLESLFDQTNRKILYTVDAFGLIANNANNEALAFLK